ncbi:MAG: translation initiation factor IF-3, partial [Clostridia bacterium]
ICLSTTIDVGDVNTKAKQAQKFLMAGDRVKVSIKLRGRQMARPEIAVRVMDDFYEILKDISQMEKRPLLEGKCMAMNLNPIVKK